MKSNLLDSGLSCDKKEVNVRGGQLTLEVLRSRPNEYRYRGRGCSVGPGNRNFLSITDLHAYDTRTRVRRRLISLGGTEGFWVRQGFLFCKIGALRSRFLYFPLHDELTPRRPLSGSRSCLLKDWNFLETQVNSGWMCRASN